jgi:hypothetical protein
MTENAYKEPEDQESQTQNTETQITEAQPNEVRSVPNRQSSTRRPFILLAFCIGVILLMDLLLVLAS